jgi:hypothetical protein
MGKSRILTVLAATSILVSSPAWAGWKLIEHDEQVKVAKGKLRVTPGEDWNRWSSRPVKRSEVWTLDGTALNEVYFISGLVAGDTLFRDRDKKNNPLPTLEKSMLLTDIPDFYESSSRIALQTSLFEIDQVEPATLAGQPAIRFTFNYGMQDSPVIRNGMAVASLVDGELHMIAFVAPEIHYFDRDLPKVQALIDSAIFK